MSRRSRPDAPFSLFAFQDIIAAVTGVMILLTLLLVLDLVTRVVGTPTDAPPAPAPTARVNPDQTQTLNDLRDQLEDRLAAEPQRVLTPAELAARRRAQADQEATDEARRNAAAAARLQRDALAVQTAADTERLDALARELADTRDRLGAERRRTRVTLLDGPPAEQQPWFLVCSPDGVTAAQLTDDRDLRPDATFPNAEQALPWAVRKSPTYDAFVLLVLPGGVPAFKALQRGLLDRGFRVGWDLASPALAADLGVAGAELFRDHTP